MQVCRCSHQQLCVWVDAHNTHLRARNTLTHTHTHIRRYDAEAQELIADDIKVAYPIRDGVPILLPEEGRKIKN